MALKTTTFCIIFFISTAHLSAQSHQDAFQFLKENIGEVMVKDVPHKQTIEYDENDCMLKIRILNTEKAEVTTYQFNAADINAYKVNFVTSRRNVLVTAETKGSKGLIRVSKNDEIKGYDKKLEFLAKDVENARGIVDNFKVIVNSCEEKQEDVGLALGANPSLNDAITYLRQNIKKIKVNDNFLNQEFKVDESFKAIVELTVINEIESETFKYKFNIFDINPPTIDFDTKGEFVFVSGTTKGERNLVGVDENGEKADYSKTFVVYVEGIEDARKLKSVLKYFAEAAENISNAELNRVNSLNTLEQLNAHLVSKTVNIVIGENNYKQALEVDKTNPFLVKYSHEYVNKGELDEYFFNLSDIDENSVHFDTRKNEVNLLFHTNGNKNVIRHMKNQEPENYENGLSVRAVDIESARVMVETLKKAVVKAKERYKPEFLSGNPSPSKSQTQNYIISAMKEVVLGDDAYQQKISLDDKNNCILLYEMQDVSKGELLTYKFNLRDINVYKVNFFTKGEGVFVHLETKGNSKLIEIIKEGVTEGFENEVNIRTTTIEEARALDLAFKRVTELCDEK